MKGTDPSRIRISIVTPSYNQAPWLGRALRSVASQSHHNREHFVLDGGSTDGSRAIIERFTDVLTWWRSTPDGGQAAAIREGFDRSTGDVLGYLNSDDELLPDALATVADFFASHRDVDVIYSHRVWMDRDSRVRGYWMLPPHSDWVMRRWAWIPQETAFWRRSIYERVGGMNADLRFALDYDLFVRFIEAGASFRRLNRFLAAFRFHSASKTATSLRDVGRAEVERIQSARGIRIGAFERRVGRLLFAGITCASKWCRGIGVRIPGPRANIGECLN